MKLFGHTNHSFICKSIDTGGNEMTDLNRPSAAAVEPAASETPHDSNVPIVPFNDPKLRQEDLEVYEPNPTSLKNSPALPALRSSAEYAANENNPQLPTNPGWGAYYDRGGKAKNDLLKQAIVAAFKLHKPSDAEGQHFVIAWRHYPNADHPRWSQPEQACGCGCGCTCSTK